MFFFFFFYWISGFWDGITCVVYGHTTPMVLSDLPLIIAPAGISRRKRNPEKAL